MEHLKSINDTQQEAVTYGTGPMLILAGAGSGKTRVLTTRITHLIKEGVKPEHILAVTFTNKAAGEIRERIEGQLGSEGKGTWLGTFHSIGLRILRREGQRDGIGALTVYDDSDQMTLVKTLLKELNINEKSTPPRVVLSKINQAKNELIGPKEFGESVSDFYGERIAKVYLEYQRRLRAMRAMDFGDLIMETVRLFDRDPERLKRYQNQFKYILVDEYQDTNRAQYILVNMLAEGHRNLCVVGDPDQSIYAWRGADISNILDFESDYPDAKTLRLEQNYRSTQNILSGANSVISHNINRLKKELWTEKDPGDPIRFTETLDDRSEVRYITETLKGNVGGSEGLTYKDCAIFYRTNAQSRVFEEHFLREGIPYTIVGGLKFYDRREIKDVLSYLKAINNPDDSLSFNRIINTPPRRIGTATIEKIMELSDNLGLSLYDALCESAERGLLTKTGAPALIKAIEAFKRAQNAEPLHKITQKLLEDTGYLGMWEKEATDEAAERIENIFELTAAISEFEESAKGKGEEATLHDFLDTVALISDIDSYEEKTNRVTMMTIHSAKGLEFPLVFMAGMEEKLFPHSRSMDSEEDIEEERRLCYVGMTRAMVRLYMTAARMRYVYGEERYQLTSRFIDEIGEDYIEHTGPSTAFSQRGSAGKGGGREYFEADESGYGAADTYFEADESQIDDHRRAGASSSSGSSGAGGTSHNDEPYYVDDMESTTLHFQLGMRVRHPSFGVGTVRGVEGAGENTKLTINFKGIGPKKLALQYATLEIL